MLDQICFTKKNYLSLNRIFAEGLHSGAEYPRQDRTIRAQKYGKFLDCSYR